MRFYGVIFKKCSVAPVMLHAVYVYKKRKNISIKHNSHWHKKLIKILFFN